MPPRTIDNLGVDVSTRYAEDQRLLDDKFIKESRGIPAQTTIDVTAPYFPSEIDVLLKAQPLQLPWALFSAPLHYSDQKKRLFTFQVIPSLGSEDKKESQAQKILAKLRSLARKKEEEKEQEKEKREEQESLFEEEEREQKILISLLDTITNLDKLIIDVNARRGQYQKG